MFLLCKHVRLTCGFNKLMMMMMMMMMKSVKLMLNVIYFVRRCLFRIVLVFLCRLICHVVREPSLWAHQAHVGFCTDCCDAVWNCRVLRHVMTVTSVQTSVCLSVSLWCRGVGAGARCATSRIHIQTHWPQVSGLRLVSLSYIPRRVTNCICWLIDWLIAWLTDWLTDWSNAHWSASLTLS